LVTSNYVVLETCALLQRRLGFQAVRAFWDDVVPMLRVQWVNERQHELGMAVMLGANRRKLSLVDCVSFCLMREAGIAEAFAFDRHFSEEGFDRPSA
jgi:predicted nucleic acid-binding protein